MKPLFSNNISGLNNAASWFVFAVSAVIYFLTADSSVSYWDCPEYTTCASLLEIGHPPGNPIWILAMRIATIPFAPATHAYVINICSGLFSSFAAFFLTRIIFVLAIWTGNSYARHHKGIVTPTIRIGAMAASIGGGLCYALCDSAWYSAVEAEVYAFSAFLTSLTIWLMCVWAMTKDKNRRTRLLILIAYITGLSLGVHQLNLLVIPVLALIYVFRNHPAKGQTLRACGAILVSFIIVGAILAVIMPGTLSLAAWTELLCVNNLHLPYFSGLMIYAVVMTSGLVTGIALAYRSGKVRIATYIWMLGFIVLGYSSFLLILIRGYAAPPMNEGAPADIFALQRYINRDQYGSTPLLYGSTPFSKPMFREIWNPDDSLPTYTKYALKKEKAILITAMPSARLYPRSGFLTETDSISNKSAIETGMGYVTADYSFSRINTPELDMWFPRITGQSPGLLESYESWAGMNIPAMKRVKVSTAIDTLGNPVGKLNSKGERETEYSYRPTYMQNLRMLASYQVYYMYIRYLLWNFMGRQNDIPSTGEIDHGNVITGISFIDDAMLGRQDLMPDYASSRNPGRNIYYGIPFILGLAGIWFLFRSGRSGKRTLAIVAMFFLMTGIAIVVYLNQSPGEPRERDYSFLGSFMAYAIWIGFGIMGLTILCSRLKFGRTVTTLAAMVISLGTAGMMLAENYDDHNRKGRQETRTFVTAMMNGLPDGIIFTYGDNFTFPLWYIQEVEKCGQGHHIVDISYLSTPEYVINMMKQGERGLKFTASPADIAYGAYAMTKVSPDADAEPVALMDALKELYAQKEGAPAFKHQNVMIPGKSPGDTIVINLKDLCKGSYIPFRQLMLLDIIATNMNGQQKLPLYFLTHLRGDFTRPVSEAFLPLGYVDVYAPGLDEKEYMRLSGQVAEAICKAGLEVGSEPHYIDPVLADQWRRQRGALIRTTDVMLKHGSKENAMRYIGKINECFPYRVVPGGSFTVADSTFHEGVEYARLLMELGDSTGREEFRDTAALRLKDLRKTAVEWRRYYASLPAWRRATVSSDSRRLITTLPKVDSLLNTISKYKSKRNL